MTCEYSLAGVVAELCERSGVPFGKFDATKLDGFVWGMQITNESPVVDHLETLADAYFFDPVQQDGILSFVHRGAEPILTISEDDLIGDSADEKTRKSPEEIVKVLNLNYYDAAGGVDTDKQTSDRSLDTRGEGEKNLNTPLVLQTDFAKQQVIIAHKVMIEEQRGDVDITLPASYLSLSTGDVVVFRNDRLRLDRVSLDVGEQRYRLKHDRKSAYESNVYGVPPLQPPPVISRVPGPTALQFMDIPILSSGDDSQLGYYMAISGGSPAWRGAKVELSIDGGQNYIESRVRNVSAVMGELLTPLPHFGAREVPDEEHTFQVRIDTFGAGLESRTFAEMLNRENRALVGDEIISFGNADEISPGVWEVSYLLRGRLGGNVPLEHPVGTRFVMLARGFLEYVPTDIYNLGQELTFRATTLGTDNQTIITKTFAGKSQTERAPSYLTASLDGTTLTISWVGNGRVGGRGSVRMGQYFAGYRVDYDGTIIDTQEQSITVAYVGGGALIKVCQLNSITGEGPKAILDYDNPNY